MRKIISSACVFGMSSFVALGCTSEGIPDDHLADVASAHHVERVPKAKIRKVEQQGDSIPGRSGHQVTVVKDKIYVSLGVFDDFNTATNTFRDDVISIDPKHHGRVKVKEEKNRGDGRPGEMSQHCAVGDDRHGGSIYSFGGSHYLFQSDPNFFASLVMFNSTYRYRVGPGTWELIPTTVSPSSRAGCHAEYYQGSMYMFGGLNRFFQLNNELWRFDIDNETWTQIPPNGPVPSPRYLGATLVDDSAGKIYLFSGHQFTPSGESTIGDFWEYTIASNTWRQLPTTVLPARDEGSFTILRTPHGKKYLVYALGHTSAPARCTGFPLQTTSVGEYWAFDPDTETWQNLDVIGDTPEIQFVRGGTVDNKHYLVGGWDDVPDPVNICKQVFNTDVYELTLDD